MWCVLCVCAGVVAGMSQYWLICVPNEGKNEAKTRTLLLSFAAATWLIACAVLWCCVGIVCLRNARNANVSSV